MRQTSILLGCAMLLVLAGCENSPNYVKQPWGGGYSAFPPTQKPSEYNEDTAVETAVKYGQPIPVYQGGQKNYDVEFADKHKAQLLNVPGFPGAGDTTCPATPVSRTPTYLPYPLQNYPTLGFDDTNFNQIQVEKDDVLTFGPFLGGFIISRIF